MSQSVKKKDSCLGPESAMQNVLSFTLRKVSKSELSVMCCIGSVGLEGAPPVIVFRDSGTLSYHKIFRVCVSPSHICQYQDFPKCPSHHLTTQDFPNVRHTFGNTRIFPNVRHTISQLRGEGWGGGGI